MLMDIYKISDPIDVYSPHQKTIYIYVAAVEKINFYLRRLKEYSQRGHIQHQVHRIDEIGINGDFVKVPSICLSRD